MEVMGPFIWLIANTVLKKMPISFISISFCLCFPVSLFQLGRYFVMTWVYKGNAKNNETDLTVNTNNANYCHNQLS